MKRELPTAVLDKLRGATYGVDTQRGAGNYVVRLATVHDRALLHGDLLRSSSTNATQALVYGRRRQIREKVLPIALKTMVMSASQGNVVAFSHGTIGISRDKRPVIDPTIPADSAFTIAHVPLAPGLTAGEIHNPARMRVDLAFTVDSDDNVTVNGRNPANTGEHALFDGLVNEFENRVAMISEQQMWAIHNAARNR